MNFRSNGRRSSSLGSVFGTARPHNELRPRLVAEFVGSAFLLIGVVGSGIMAQRLTEDEGLRLLQNAFATGTVLVALILAFQPASGAHFNPAVTIASRIFRDMTTRDAAAYVVVQITGGVTGVVVANLMFDLPAVEWSTTARSGSHLWLAEVVATLGLLLVIFGPVRSGRASTAAFSVGAYIGGAYYFTSSTSFANPAVTIARSLSDTFAGIDPAHVGAFVLAQLVGTAVAVLTIEAVYPSARGVVAGAGVQSDAADGTAGLVSSGDGAGSSVSA